MPFFPDRRTFLAYALIAPGILRSAGANAGAGPLIAAPLAPDDDALLEDLSRRAFTYFWEQGDPSTGLVRDRARADGSAHVPAQRDVASIAATGFGVAALAIGRDRAWRPAGEIAARVRSTLAFLARELPHEHG